MSPPGLVDQSVDVSAAESCVVCRGVEILEHIVHAFTQCGRCGLRIDLEHDEATTVFVAHEPFCDQVVVCPGDRDHADSKISCELPQRWQVRACRYSSGQNRRAHLHPDLVVDRDRRVGGDDDLHVATFCIYTHEQ